MNKKGYLISLTLLSASLISLAACSTSESKKTANDKQEQTVEKNLDSSKEENKKTAEVKEENSGKDTNNKYNENTEEEKKTPSPQINKEVVKEKPKSEEKLPDVKQDKEKSEDKESEKKHEDLRPVHDLVITSGESAIGYLKTQIEEGKNEDIDFGATEETQTDSRGSYYLVRLTSISLRVAGGTGTVENYKVYEDGAFELYRAN